MRFHMKLCVLLLVVAVAAGDGSLPVNYPGSSTGSPTSSTQIPSSSSPEFHRVLLEIMNKHFSDSLKYLYTSKQYDSQYMQRPGMAKYLMEASDFEWEQGIDFLKKHLQRQGTITDFRRKLAVSGKGELTLGNDENKFEKYFETFTNLISDAEAKFKLMNDNATKSDNEICHYLDEKLEKNVARLYELRTHSKNLEGMKSFGVAVNAFDSAL